MFQIVEYMRHAQYFYVTVAYFCYVPFYFIFNFFYHVNEKLKENIFICFKQMQVLSLILETGKICSTKHSNAQMIRHYREFLESVEYRWDKKKCECLHDFI